MKQSVTAIRRWLKESRTAGAAVFVVENVVAALRPRQIRIRNGSREPQYFLSAMVRAKDEGRFLPEWIAYHHNLGVDHFYVYDNGSTDGTPQILAPLINAGLVTYESWPQRPISPTADLHFLSEYGVHSQWVAFFDADEFVCEDVPGRLRAVLLGNSHRPAIAMNWRYFGSSYHDTVPDGLVVENFTLADSVLDRHVKVIAQPARIRRYRNSHNRFYNAGRFARTPDGRRVFASFVYPSGATGGALVLNHYVYRSRADYERKARQGFVDARGALDQARQAAKIESEFVRHNEQVLALPADLLTRTRETLKRMGYGQLHGGGGAFAPPPSAQHR